ncbi:MAG TPA: hypothetical protein VFJ30_01315 [Phycisphaerae bacterium]|nr:hypothetical protein [Phycisphaerae bacterium]
MLDSRRPQGGSSDGQGCLRQVFAELQCRGAGSKCEEGLRQRLIVLARRLARVQALGDEYGRVSFSEHVQVLLNGTAVTV